MDNEILWGYHPVYEALRAGRRTVFTVYVAQGGRNAREKDVIQYARRAGVAVQAKTAQQLTALVGHRRHQGICASVSGYPMVTLDVLLAVAETRRQETFLLVLDQVVDPQNLGAVARTAQCAGVHGVVILKDRSASPTAAACKASAGALEYMQLACVTNLSEALKRLKASGIWIVGADQQAQETVFQADMTGPLAVVVGAEEKGIRPLVRKQCDRMVSIPQCGPIGSLNASAAAAVILYETFRQRNSASGSK
jgi:23S rRNA (guanosine2251-2'-O)-methyltransferase